MNIEQVIHDIKALVADATGYREHLPRMSENTMAGNNAPNAGVYRVAVLGAGKQKQVGLNRYADLAVVLSVPLSGADMNKTNEQAAIEAERIIDTLADYDGEEAQTAEAVEAELIREAGRQVSTFACRVNYKYTEE